MTKRNARGYKVADESRIEKLCRRLELSVDRYVFGSGQSVRRVFVLRPDEAEVHVRDRLWAIEELLEELSQ